MLQKRLFQVVTPSQKKDLLMQVNMMKAAVEQLDFEAKLIFCEACCMVDLNQDAFAIIDQLTQATPEDQRLTHLKAAVLLKTGNVKEAQQYYTKLLENPAKVGEGHYGLGLILKKQEKLQEAMERFSKAFEVNPKLISAVQERSELASRLGLIEVSKKDKDLAKKAYLARSKELSQQGDLNSIGELMSALQIDPEYADALLERAKLMLSVGNTIMARADISKLVALNPGEPMAWIMLVQVSPPHQHAEILQKGVAANPQNSMLTVSYASQLLQQGKAEKALETIDNFIITFPQHEDVNLLNFRVQCLASMNRLNEAISIIADIAKNEHQNEEVYMLFSDVFQRAENIVEAERYVDICLSKNPQNGAALYKKTLFKIQAAKAVTPPLSEQALRQVIEEGLKNLDLAIQLNPTVELYGSKARLLDELNRVAEALKSVEDGLKLNSKRPDLHAYRAQLLMKSEENDLALNAIDRAISLAPQQPQYKGIRGFVLNSLDRYIEAIPILKEALLSPRVNQLTVRVALVTALTGGQAEEQAITLLDSIIAQQPKNVDLKIMRIAPLLYLLRYKEALAVIEEIQKIEPNKQHLSIYKAYCLHFLGEEKEAIELVDKAIEQNPTEHHYYLIKGEFYTHQKHYEQALEIINKAIEMNPDKQSPQYSVRSICLFKTNRLEEALKSISTAISKEANRMDYHLIKAAIYLMRNEQTEFVNSLRASRDVSENVNARSIGGSIYTNFYKQIIQKLTEVVRLLDNPLNEEASGVSLKSLFEKYLFVMEIDELNIKVAGEFVKELESIIAKLPPKHLTDINHNLLTFNEYMSLYR